MKKAGASQSEDTIQAGCVRYFEWLEGLNKQFTFTHPNATNSNIRRTMYLKRLGQKSGVPDLVFFLEGGRTLFFELKAKGKRGKLSSVQENFHGVLRTLGFRVDTIYAYDTNHALDQIIPILRLYGIRIPD